MNTRVRLLLVSAVALGGLVASLSAQAADKKSDSDKPAKSGKDRDTKDKDAKPEAKSDPDNVTGISRYMEALMKGNGKYAARDFGAALDAYRGAIPLSPRNPIGHYLVAETQIALANLTEADASLAQAEPLTDDRNPSLRAKVLFLTADVRERQKRWDEAKAAWQSYADYAGKHAEVAFAASATSRLHAIDDMVKQDKAYEAVRQRIATEKADKAAGKK